MFRAIVIEESEGKVVPELKELEEASLPENDVEVDIEYSSLNYKDGMVLKGLGRLVRNYPHIPGVDFAGTVAKSEHADFKAGDKVLLTGWRVGETHWGGYAEKAKVKGEWLVPLPDGMTSRQAMAVGTAGFSAMLSVMALEEHGVTNGKKPVLVTGATGGVGSVAVALLARLGHKVAASTGKAAARAYLESLGAETIIGREEVGKPSGKPLESERWGGAIDAVGGDTLACILPQMAYGSSVAAVGLTAGHELHTTVIPFLLRGINLLGIDSVLCPTERRRTAWQRIAKELPMDKFEKGVREVGLEQVIPLASDILKGDVKGRVVIKVNA